MSKTPKLKASKQVTAKAATVRGPAPAIHVEGQLNRISHLAFQTSIYIPQDLRERIEDRLASGALSTAIIGLCVFALDQLDKGGKDLQIQTDAEL